MITLHNIKINYQKIFYNRTKFQSIYLSIKIREILKGNHIFVVIKCRTKLDYVTVAPSMPPCIANVSFSIQVTNEIIQGATRAESVSSHNSKKYQVLNKKLRNYGNKLNRQSFCPQFK